MKILTFFYICHNIAIFLELIFLVNGGTLNGADVIPGAIGH